MDSPAGQLATLLPPVTMPDFEARIDPVPALGEHRERILSEISYSSGVIAALAESRRGLRSKVRVAYLVSDDRGGDCFYVTPASSREYTSSFKRGLMVSSRVTAGPPASDSTISGRSSNLTPAYQVFCG
jgi:hypothetical protein